MRSRALIGLLTALAVSASGLMISAPAQAASLTAAGLSVAAETDVMAAAPSRLSSASVASSTIAPLPRGTLRLAGADRYSTAIQVAKQYSAGVPAVFVATGSNFPDALSAAAAASLVGGPLLLTPTTSLPRAVADEIRRLQPERIFVIGGTGAVSNAVLRALKGIAPATRLGADDRYSTGLKIVSTAFTAADTAFIATGRSFPDALAATGAAGAMGSPVILVDGALSAVSQSTIRELDRLGVQNVQIAGGTGAVSTGIERQLRQRYDVTRYGGGDRYTTAALINDAFFSAGSTDTMFLATGTNFPDALAGAALAGRLGAPLYVTSAACVPDSVRNSIASLGAAKRVVMGGTSVVSDAAVKNTGCLASAAPTIAGSAKVASTLTARPGAWTAGTSFSYQWLANGAVISGATGASFTIANAQAGKRISVKVTGSRSGYTTVSRVSAATANVAYPSQTTPSGWNCPDWAPIKGNASSMIYHVKGGQFYDRTNPEECFATEKAARDAGYRKSQR